MKRIFLAAILSAATVSFAAETRWDHWLQNEGFYLLSPDQKDKMEKLADPEKEIFVRNLLASLDPNTLTPENEFEVEYKKRFEFAKKRYGIPSDRAKIYILLGPPNSVESHDNSDKYYPMELWSYYSLGIRGLPPSLDLIFFRRYGTGDMKLYSPLFDGLKTLSTSQIDLDNPRVKNMLKAFFDASVVQASEHISTGYGANESEIVRAYLTDPAAIQKTYLKSRPSVETTVVYQGFEADIYTYSAWKEKDVYRTSIAIAIPPRYLTFELEEGSYRGRIDMIGRINDDKGNEILQVNDSPALKMTEKEYQGAKTYYLSYLFDAYLLPGKYTLSCLFRDYVSNAAGRMEKTFEVLPVGDEVELLPLLTAIRAAPATAEEAPFVYGWQQYFPKEDSTFNASQTVVLYTALLNPKRVKLDGIWKLKMILKSGDTGVLEVDEDAALSGTDTVHLARNMRLQSLPPGPYTAVFSLTRNGITYATETPVKISMEPEVLGRVRITPSFERTPEQYHANLSLQYFYRNDLAEASKHARIAQDFVPSSYPARSLMARIEKAKGNTEAAIKAYEQLLLEYPADSEGFYLIGKWAMDLKDWNRSEDMMKKAIQLGYFTRELLNNLASVEISLGRPKDAVEYWQKSLALDDNQPEIKALIAQHQ